MRTAIVIALTAAIWAAPASAQNDTTNATVDANATMAMPADNGTMPAVDANAVPTQPATETTEPAPAPVEHRKSSGGFPWGVVGLVGLVGLLGRKRRD